MYGNNLLKLFKSIDLLAAPEGCTISKIQEQLSISRRSVYRLLDTLKDLNFPLKDERAAPGEGDVWKLAPDYLLSLPNINLKDLKLTKEEIILLFFLFIKTSTFRHTELDRYFESLKNKLNVFLPFNLKHPKEITKLDDIFIPSSAHLGDYSSQEDVLDDITDSIVHLNRCIVTYHSFIYNDIKRFQIDPLKLFEHSGSLYVLAHVIDFDSIGILTVRRIKQIAVIDQHFDFPEGFDPDEVLDSAAELIIGEPVSARIWFAQEVAEQIRQRKWAFKQEITEQPDGSIVLSIGTSGVLDIRKWVLSFGSKAKVIEPRILIDEIEAEIERMRNVYK
jgi:predicted DNA-binding transcriptional regulator YafY